MNQELDTTLRQLHVCYCEFSGHVPPYATCERRLLEFHNAGFDVEDLALVLKHIFSVNRGRETSFRLSVRFGNLVGDLERFGDLLGESRASKRAREHKAKHSYPEAKASVLRSSGRSDTPTVPENVLTSKEALERLKASL